MPSSATAAAPAPAAQAHDAALFRIFLTDGTALASYGEFARVGERVVFTLPIGREQRMASVGAAEIDWEKTDRYSHSVRAANYAATRGDTEYAEMSQRVARMLTEISRLGSADDQLRLADGARLLLSDWPKSHYGYKAAEVHETLGVLDEIIGGLRARAGRSNFDLNLVAGAAAPPVAPLLIAPSLQDSIAQVLRLSTLAASPAERLDLLRGAMAGLEAASATLPREWVGNTRGRLRDAIESEEKTDRAYATLVSSTLTSSRDKLARADVRGLATLRDRVMRRDQRLGRQRPEQVQSLLATLDQRLDAARRLRLARDQWQVRARGYREYGQTIAPAVALLQWSAALLGDIRALAGPTSSDLARFDQRLAAIAPALRRVTPPEELRPAHTSLVSAWQMAEAAVRQRTRAIAGNDMKMAWDASAAAAGALMLFERAQADLTQATRAPELP